MQAMKLLLAAMAGALVGTPQRVKHNPKKHVPNAHDHARLAAAQVKRERKAAKRRRDAVESQSTFG